MFSYSASIKPTQIIKNESTTAFKVNKRRKVIENCESKHAAEESLRKSSEVAIKEVDIDGLSAPITWRDIIKMKHYLMKLLTGKIQHLNPIAMTGTQ